MAPATFVDYIGLPYTTPVTEKMVLPTGSKSEYSPVRWIIENDEEMHLYKSPGLRVELRRIRRDFGKNPSKYPKLNRSEL